MNESAAPLALRFYPGNLHIRGIQPPDGFTNLLCLVPFLISTRLFYLGEQKSLDFFTYMSKIVI